MFETWGVLRKCACFPQLQVQDGVNQGDVLLYPIYCNIDNTSRSKMNALVVYSREEHSKK